MARISKALAALSAAAAVFIPAGLISGNLSVWITGIISAATAFVGVYAAPKNAE